MGKGCWGRRGGGEGRAETNLKRMKEAEGNETKRERKKDREKESERERERERGPNNNKEISKEKEAHYWCTLTEQITIKRSAKQRAYSFKRRDQGGTLMMLNLAKEQLAESAAVPVSCLRV